MTIKNARKGISCAIAVALAGLLALYFSNKIFPNEKGGSLMSILAYALPIALAAIIIYATRRQKFHFYTAGTFKTVFTIGLIIPATACVYAVLSYLSGAYQGQVSTMQIVGFAVYCLATGFFEEMIFRVLGQGYLMDGWNNEGQGPLGAIIMASVIFGAVHFFNLIQQPTLVLSTIAQVGYSFALGFMLGVIFYKTQSLLSVALLHGLYNFIGSFSSLYSTGAVAQVKDIAPNAILVSWVIMVPGLIISYLFFKGVYRSASQQSL